MADISRAMTPMDEDPTEDLPIEVEVGEEPSIEVEVVPDPEVPHTANLAEFIEEDELQRIASDLLSGFDDDENSRSEWLRQYTDGLDYLGFSTDDRQTPFKGASGVYHPVMTEAVVRFQSNAIMEIFPASGPVLTKIIGEDTDEKYQQSVRVKEELNYQLTENMVDYRNETEQLLFRLPLAGSVFKKTYFDPLGKKPCSHMVVAEDLVVDYGTTTLETAERITEVLRYAKNKVKKLQRAGFYRKADLGDPTPHLTDGKEKEDRIVGVEKVGKAEDNRYVLLEFHVNYNLPEPFNDPDDIADPYIITVDKSTNTVLAIRRNWKEGDANREKECYFTHFQYMPGLGFYGTGLIQLMGAIAKASTSILRQLIDAGTLANLPGGLKARGLRTKGGEDPIAPGEWRDVDVPSGSIRDNIMPLPYKDPSSVLAALLQSLIEEGRRIGSIADVEISSGSENAPVGTTLALMERSLKVMSAVHARLHASMKKELKLIAKVISEYMPPQYDWDTEGKYDRSKDFDGRVDIVPVSDPNAATQAQRIVQMQAVMQLASQAPELYNMKELHRAGLQAIGLKNDERILPYDREPPRMDPVQENMSVLTQQPIKVYEDQDHQAHITTHISAMMDPSMMEMIGQSPNAPKIQSQMEAHIAEHLAHQYRQEIQETMGVELPPLGEELPPEIENRLARMVAAAATRLRKKHEAEAQQKQAEQIAADPVFQLREREVAIKEKALDHQMRKDAADDILDAAKAISKESVDLRRIESEEMRAGAKIGADLVTFGATLEAEDRRQGVALGKEIQENLRSDAREFQRMSEDSNLRREQMQHDREERERDRQNAKELARTKARTGGKSGNGSSD